MEKLAKTDLILFSVILPLSILMRVPGLLYPLEFSGDEMGYLAKALKFGTGDLNPHYFVHPALSFYITFVAEAVFFVFGYFLGFFHSVSEFSTLFFNNPAPFLFAGRLPSLLFGAGTIYLVYLMGKNFFSKEVAICTALMLAITPLHIFESQTIRIRSIATFFGILCLYFIFTILKKGEKKDYVLAGLSLGLCLATEYTMIFFTLPLFTVIILNLQNKFFLKNGPTVSPKKGILFALSIALAILITCTPYTFFDYPANFKNITHFLNFGIDPTTVSNGNTVPEVSQGFHSEDINTNYVQAIVIVKQYISRVYYQIAHLFNLEYTIGKMFATVSIAGVLFAIYKREKEDLLLLSPLAGFFVIQPLFVFALPRMIIMTYPILLLLAARFLVHFIKKAFLHRKQQKYAFYVIIFVLALPNIVWSTQHNKKLLQKDTRLMAKAWIEENIPSGSHILLQGEGSMRGAIQLNESKISLSEKYIRYKSIIDTIPNYHGNALKAVEIKMKNIKEPSYRIDYFFKNVWYGEHFRTDFMLGLLDLGILTVEEYKKIGIDYIVTATYTAENGMKNLPDFYAFLKSLENECRLIKVFRYQGPPAENRYPLINPEIKIYGIRKEWFDHK